MSIEQVQSFKTSDGKLFPNIEQATGHQQYLDVRNGLDSFILSDITCNGNGKSVCTQSLALWLIHNKNGLDKLFNKITKV